MDRYERVRRAVQIGDRIRLGGIDIAKLSDDSRVDTRTIQSYVDGTVRRPQAGVVERLMLALGIGVDDPPTEAEALDAIKGLLDSLPTDQQPALVARLVEEAVRYIGRVNIAVAEGEAVMSAGEEVD